MRVRPFSGGPAVGTQERPIRERPSGPRSVAASPSNRRSQPPHQHRRALDARGGDAANHSLEAEPRITRRAFKHRATEGGLDRPSGRMT